MITAKNNKLSPLASLYSRKEEEEKEKNKGGFLGGVRYLGMKARDGVVGSVEGIWDFAAGGLADLFGADKWAEEQIKNTWIDYNEADEWFNPGEGWKFAGDVAHGIGNSVPGIAASLVLGAATGGTSLAVQATAGIGTSFGLSFLSAGGNAVREAYSETGKLTGKEWGYGALTGAVEGAVESADTMFGLGATGVARALGKNIAMNGARNGFLKSVFKGAFGEGTEEFVSGALSGAIKRATYDPNAENMSGGELTYTSFVGAISGALMGGGSSAVRSGIDLVEGAAISSDEKRTSEVMEAARRVREYEGQTKTENEIIGEVISGLSKLESSIEKTDGKVKTAEQKRMLGYLNERLGVTALQPEFMSAVATLVSNPEATVESLNKFYGQETITVEELTRGLGSTDISSKAYRRTVSKALKNNATLRNLATMQVVGKMELDSRRYADAILGDTSISAIATQENVNRFVEREDEESIAAVNSALGIDVRSASAEELATALAAARDNGELEAHRGSIEAIREALKLRESSGELPINLTVQSEGAVRYTTDGRDVAVVRKGGKYYVYDYKTGKITKPLNASEAMISAAKMKKAAKQAAESTVKDTEAKKAVNTHRNEKSAVNAEKTGEEREARSEGVSKNKQNGKSVLKSISKDGIINTNESEAGNEGGESIRIRNGSKRDGGKNTQRQVSRVEGSTRQAESRGKVARVADSEAARIVNEGREVKVADLGILGGSTEQTVRVVDKANETSSMKEARKRAEARGLKVKFIVGDNLVIKDRTGEWISVRGYIQGNYVFVRADHPLYTADQIMRHELGHDMIAKGEVDIDAVRERLVQKVGKENVDAVAKAYADAYEGSGMSAEDIWEECICDSLGDMNVFIGKNEDSASLLDTMLPDISAAASETKSPTQTRGSPDGKASRDTYTKTQYNNFGWVRDNDILNEGYWDNFTRNYADAVYSKGFDRITPDGEYMIEIYDQNLEERLQVIDHIVFAKGNIKSPNVTKIIQIYEVDETKLDKYRRNIYDFERRGIQQETGELLELHRKTDFGAYDKEGNGRKVSRYSKQFAAERGRGSSKAPRVKEYIFEVEESEVSGKASRELDSKVSHSDNGKRSSLQRGRDAEGREGDIARNPYVSVTDRGVVADSLLSVAMTGAEQDVVLSYVSELGALTDVLGERSELLGERTEVVKQLKDAYYKKDKSAQVKLRARLKTLREQIERADDKIARRDAELLKTTSAAPFEEMVFRAYEIGRKEGQSAKLSFGTIQKVRAEMMNAKFFQRKEAKEAIDAICDKYSIEDYLVRSELAHEFWQALNSTENEKDQKLAIRNVASKVVRAYDGRRGGRLEKLREARAIVKAVEAYKGKVFIDDAELSGLSKTGDSVRDEINAFFGYVPSDDVHPQSVRSVINHFSKSNRFRGMNEWAKGSVEKADALAKIYFAYKESLETVQSEDDKKHVSEATAIRNDVIDLLTDAFNNGGRQTYKARYEELKGTMSYANRCVDAARKLGDLKLGIFTNTTENDNAELFSGSVLKLSGIKRGGGISVKVATDAIAGLKKWYVKENKMLCYENEENPGYYSESIATALDMLASHDEAKPYSAQDFRVLYEIMSYFNKLVTNYNKVQKDGKWVDAKELGKRFAEKRSEVSNNSTIVGKMLQTKYVRLFGDSKTVLNAADGFGGGFFSEMFEDIRRGLVDAEVTKMEVMAEYDAFMKAREHRKFIAESEKRTIKIRGKSVPRLAFIEYYMSLHRQQAWEGLTYAGFVYTDKDGTKIEVPAIIPKSQLLKELEKNGSGQRFVGTEEEMKKLSDKAEWKLTPEKLQETVEREKKSIEKELTAEEKEYISILERGYEAAKRIKEATDNDRLGFSNVIDGYYYPIRRYGAGTVSLDSNFEMGEVDRFTNASFNKNTVKGAAQQLEIRSADSTFQRHIQNVALYARVAPAIETYDRLWRVNLGTDANTPVNLMTIYSKDSTVWKDKNGGIVGHEYLKQLITDIKNPSVATGLVSKIRGAYATYALGLNPKVLLTQFSSLFAASSELSWRSLFRGMLSISGADVDSYCKLAKLRNNDYTVVKSQSASEKLSRFAQATTFLIPKFDRIVVKRLFASCQAEVARTRGLKLGTVENKIAAGKLLETVILNTQQNTLTTERSEAMRGTSEMNRTLTMFRADSVKNAGRLLDSFGECAYYSKRIKNSSGKIDAEEMKTLKSEYKRAKKKRARAIASIVTSSLYMILVGEFFMFLYNKDRDEDQNVIVAKVLEFFGNIIGGFPVFSQIYSSIVEGYDFEGLEYTAIQDMIESTIGVGEYVGKMISGESTYKDAANALKNVLYSAGQYTGIPVRNAYNFVYGLIKRFNEKAAYSINNLFYDQSFGSDIALALENDDTQKAVGIFEIALGERLGGNFTSRAAKELNRLVTHGLDVLPLDTPTSVTVTEGEESVTLKASEREAIGAVYSRSVDAVNKLIENEIYKSMSDEKKAKAVKRIMTMYRNIGIDTVLGTDKSGKAYALSGTLSGEGMVLYSALASLESDKDEDGKTVTGSLRKKVISYLRESELSQGEKLIILAARGYTYKDGDIKGLSAYKAGRRLAEYVNALGLSLEELERICEIVGLSVKNGKAVSTVKKSTKKASSSSAATQKKKTLSVGKSLSSSSGAKSGSLSAIFG